MINFEWKNITTDIKHEKFRKLQFYKNIVCNLTANIQKYQVHIMRILILNISYTKSFKISILFSKRKKNVRGNKKHYLE